MIAFPLPIAGPHRRFHFFGQAVLALAVLLSASVAQAGPFLAAGDVGMRHDLQLLADSGIVRSPLTTWPLSWPDIAREINRGASLAGQPDSVRYALRRVKVRLEQEMDGKSDVYLVFSAAGEHRPLRTFGDTPRREEEEQLGIEMMGSYAALRLQATSAKDKGGPMPYDNTHADGSYLAFRLGNWSLGVDSLDRWWGPGWEGSLILSSNARPVPVVALTRTHSDPFETRWLRWMGPWNLVVFMGELEDLRDYSRAKLFGARLNFKPTPNLEVGVSRTAQWGGEGRPEDWNTFQNLLLGKDNAAELTSPEPGNQLGGFDFRWSFPVLRFALYGQGIGEDEAGNLPSHYMKMLGTEIWFCEQVSCRLHVEFADTRAKLWNYAYNHGIYIDGYRFYGESMGHAMDNDGRMLSLGLLAVLPGGTAWQFLVRKSELNRDDTGQNTVAPRAQNRDSIELVNRIPLGQNALAWGFATERRTEVASGVSEKMNFAFVRWRMDW